MIQVKSSGQGSNQQLTEVAGVIAQIQESAESVAKTVSALFKSFCNTGYLSKAQVDFSGSY
jgi:hypothetical protein